jgi:hypothetical protein
MSSRSLHIPQNSNSLTERRAGSCPGTDTSTTVPSGRSTVVTGLNTPPSYLACTTVAITPLSKSVSRSGLALPVTGEDNQQTAWGLHRSTLA